MLDTDLDVEIQPYLEALGFQTEFALNISADHRSDVDLLRWARMNDYIRGILNSCVNRSGGVTSS